jgi:proteasome lid subunit RPN8/RPN11
MSDERKGPVLKFWPSAFAKLMHWRSNADNIEISGFGISEREDLLSIQDFKLVDQVCSAASTKMDDDGLGEYFDDMVDQGYSARECLRIWIHTHPGFSTTPSGKDEETFATRLKDAEWGVMCIVSDEKHVYTRLFTRKPVEFEIDIPTMIDWTKPIEPIDYEELNAEYKEKVTKETYSTYYGGVYGGTYKNGVWTRNSGVGAGRVVVSTIGDQKKTDEKEEDICEWCRTNEATDVIDGWRTCDSCAPYTDGLDSHRSSGYGGHAYYDDPDEVLDSKPGKNKFCQSCEIRLAKKTIDGFNMCASCYADYMAISAGETEAKIEIGDKVVIKEPITGDESTGRDYIGKEGTVVRIDPKDSTIELNLGDILVWWDIDGVEKIQPSLGKCEHCWNAPADKWLDDSMDRPTIICNECYRKHLVEIEKDEFCDWCKIKPADKEIAGLFLCSGCVEKYKEYALKRTPPQESKCEWCVKNDSVEVFGSFKLCSKCVEVAKKFSDNEAETKEIIEKIKWDSISHKEKANV